MLRKVVKFVVNIAESLAEIVEYNKLSPFEKAVYSQMKKNWARTKTPKVPVAYTKKEKVVKG